jgi:peptidoglycan DL-endopeptidase CwlO
VSLHRTSRRTRAAAVVAGVLIAAGTGIAVPTTAAADPRTAAEALAFAEKAAQELTAIDEQVHQAELAVEAQQHEAREASAAAKAAAVAVGAFEPQLRAIAQSGYTGRSQSRVAAFLTSESAHDLVQQMTTLDMIARHTDAVVARAAAAQDEALQAQAAADAAAAKAGAGLAELEKRKVEVQKKVDEYEAMFDRLTAREQARLTQRVAGRTLAAPSVSSLSLAPGSAAAVAIEAALSKVGAPYVWGASGPNGFDCSGLTQFAYAAAGISLPHSSGAQSGLGRPVSRAELQPGDLVFFYSPISHVGLYIGDGKMVHARTFGQPVAVTSVDQAGYVSAVRPV